jgi:hypothetical protein
MPAQRGKGRDGGSSRIDARLPAEQLYWVCTSYCTDAGQALTHHALVVGVRRHAGRGGKDEGSEEANRKLKQHCRQAQRA